MSRLTLRLIIYILSATVLVSVVLLAYFLRDSKIAVVGDAQITLDQQAYFEAWKRLSPLYEGRLLRLPGARIIQVELLLDGDLKVVPKLLSEKGTLIGAFLCRTRFVHPGRSRGWYLSASIAVSGELPQSLSFATGDNGATVVATQEPTSWMVAKPRAPLRRYGNTWSLRHRFDPQSEIAPFSIPADDIRRWSVDEITKYNHVTIEADTACLLLRAIKGGYLYISGKI